MLSSAGHMSLAAHPLPHQHQQYQAQRHQQNSYQLNSKSNPANSLRSTNSNANPHSPSHSHSHSHSQQLKPSPLSSADNLPRPDSLHNLNAVQAVHAHYSSHTTPTSYTHAQTTPTHSNSSSTSNLVPTATATVPAFASSHPPPSAGSLPSLSHKLRRMPGGANLAEFRHNAHNHNHGHGHGHMRTNSLSSGSSSSKHALHMNGGGASPAGAPSSAAVNMPSISAIAAGPNPANAAHGGRGFDGPRSPPNTAHVPCKFFRQGACQAGSACPFSHDLGAAAENICKYFAKGNCKFGPKCANIHVLPDGRRLNYGKNGVTVSPINFGNRLNPLAYGGAGPNSSALTTSFMRAGSGDYSAYANATPDEQQHYRENGLPTIDTHQYNPSGPTSPYGSPPAQLALSPVGGGALNGLSVLDAPLPASFDSNGISHAARYGPWPASVPNKFGLESPSPSLHNAKDQRTSETLKMLHTSAFGSSEHLSPSHLGGDVESGNLGTSMPMGMNMGSSPPAAVPIGDEFFGRRMMHSASSKYAKPRMLSSSAPKVNGDWDVDFQFLEEDYLPGELANELLTGAEKARRGSVRVSDETGNGSGENSAKYGSPIGTGASSPSRWNTLFERQQKPDEQQHGSSGGGGALAKSLKSPGGAFGHVGSPLRNSSLARGIDLIGAQNGNSSRPSLAGSRTGSAGAEGLSALTQQIQRFRMGDDGNTGPSNSTTSLHPSTASSRAVGSGGSKPDARLERHLSNRSISSQFTTPISEEDPNFIFSMEEDEEASMREKSRQQQQQHQQHQKQQQRPPGGASGGWSYASVASKTSGGNGSAIVETR